MRQITLNLDEELVQSAMKLYPDLPLEKTIESALWLYIQQQQKQQVIELFGTIDYDPDYDYKVQRRF